MLERLEALEQRIADLEKLLGRGPTEAEREEARKEREELRELERATAPDRDPNAPPEPEIRDAPETPIEDVPPHDRQDADTPDDEKTVVT